jgi:Tol biopolymer transport system component
VTVAASADDRSSIVVMDLSGAVLDTLISSTDSHFDCPQWSPTRDEVVFTRYHIPGNRLFDLSSLSDDGDLEIVDVETKTVRALVVDEGISNYGGWSRDGEWIAFQSARHLSGATTQGEWFAGLEIYVVRRDGSGLRRLTHNDHFDAHPSW